jgi:Zn-dependent peptidase ImmA (M78 family)/transcriptional regulator with XRE-family HTH domain
MNAHAPKQPALPFNRDMLRWAREQREVSIDEAAHKVGVRPELVAEWEGGGDRGAVPTVRQARLLSDLYQRAFLEFFRNDPPPVAKPHLVPDFRLHRDAPKPHETRDLRDLQGWAEEIRLNALDLYEMLGEEPPKLPDGVKVAMAFPASAAAAYVRGALDFPIEEQTGRNQADRTALPKVFRAKLEAAAILVLKDNSLAEFGARGLCLAADPLPIIVFGGEAPSAQMFTLAHELAHVALGESAISGPPADRGAASPEAKVEQWCNQFAAAFLIPANALASVLEQPAAPEPRIGEQNLAGVARHFGVSEHAMLLRLIDLRYVSADFYWNEMRAIFLAREADFRGGGRPKYYGSRYRNAHGDLYTSLVLEAWGSRAITNHNAAEFMGIKNIRHLEDIRKNFGAE